MTENQKLDADAAARMARQQLESLRRAGMQTLPKPQGTHAFDFGSEKQATASPVVAEKAIEASATAPAPAAETPAQKQTATPAQKPPAARDAGDYGTPLAAPERISQLTVLQNEVAGCEACPELVANRSQTVFGVGNATPRLCFLGEGPGADEDRQGEPFVGAAGQLLNKILGACKMKREDVYILNTVKCRPPGNRNPSETELANCWGYAQRQLEILQPEFICCLGSVAARTILETKMSVGKMRGQFFSYRGSRVLVTYHPAYLLRNPDAKRKVWDDMKMLLSEMGLEL